MEIMSDYWPGNVFVPAGLDQSQGRRVFIAPQRYVQGPNSFRDLGRMLGLVGARSAAILISPGGERRHGVDLVAGLNDAGVAPVIASFGGECSLEEIGRHAQELGKARVDCVIAVGGGKAIDAGKGIAHRLGVPVVVAPTLASNDAPCSALSVIYSEEGISTGTEIYPHSPALVLVDTAIVARAPARYLVSGMGDAAATWYEASVVSRNPRAMNVLGARPTLAAKAIGEDCLETLFEKGVDARRAVIEQQVTSSLEDVVEANTLLSGIGFESGGLAAAHAFAQAFTALSEVESNYLHGEMVAMGTLAQLALEERFDECDRVGRFFAEVGLPVTLAQLSLDAGASKKIDTVVEGALAFPFIGNMSVEVNADRLERALLKANGIGTALTDKFGDRAYRELHA